MKGTDIDIKASVNLTSRCMRTTLTLDDDVAAILERLRKCRDATLKNLVNEALRRVLEPHGANVCRRDQSRLAGCELQSSTTLAKPSPLPRATPTSDIGRRQYSHLWN